MALALPGPHSGIREMAESLALSQLFLMDIAMDELNGRMIACQLLVAGLIARAANALTDPLRFLTDFRDEMHAVAAGVRLDGSHDDAAIRTIAQQTLDELFPSTKPPRSTEDSEP